MSETEVSKAAKTLSRLGASKGGKARANKLTAERRADIASNAASVRWGIPRADHVGEIHIGDMRFPCSVLSDGTRILTQSDFMSGMGMYYSGWVARSKTKNQSAADIPHFLAFKSLEPFIDKHLGDLQSIAVRYRTEKGHLAHGIKAEIIPKICEVWLDADEYGKLGSRQKQIAQKAKILMRALAHVGIIALVDEATGYQKFRRRDELHKILELYIAKELLPWAKRFPDEFYQEIFRLQRWNYTEVRAHRMPKYVGKLTNRIVYDKLPEGILEELRKKNPVISKGRRSYRHHQFLTEDIGHPHLEKHIASVTALMRASDNLKDFKILLEKAYPTPKNTMQIEMDFNEDDDVWQEYEEKIGGTKKTEQIL